MKKIIFSTLLSVSSIQAIVDIAPVEIGDKPGMSGNIAGSYVTKSGNTDKDEYDLGGKLQYDNNTDAAAFIQASYEKTKSSGVKTEDQTFAHARYLHTLGSAALYGEAFIQYKQDIFKEIDYRLLSGANIRWRYVDNAEWGKLFLGLGIMHETIHYKNSPRDPAGTPIEPNEKSPRFNSYMAYKHTISDNAKVSMIGYYQPDIEQNSDYYASYTAELQVAIIKELYLSLAYEYDYDSRPPMGVKTSDQMTKTSIIWKF